MLRPALIELSNVSFGYGNRVVIKELSLKIKEGEFLFIVGANGSGKSSLIRGLLGTLLPLGGQIQRHQSTKLIGAVGFVPQRFVATANMPIDVSEFILLGTVGTTLSNINLKDRLSEILVRMELGDLSQRSFWSLSVGQQQRVLIARAMLREPNLLLLDEPSAGLDFIAERELLNTLANLNRELGTTIVLSTHNLSLLPEHDFPVLLVSNQSCRHLASSANLGVADLIDNFR